LKTVSNKIYLEFNELVQLGIAESTLRNAKFENRPFWVFINDPADNRKVLIEFDALKDKYKELVKTTYGEPAEYIANEWILNYYERDAKAFVYYSAYQLPNGKGLPSNHIETYTLAASTLNMINRITKGDGKQALSTVGITKQQLWAAFLKYIKANSIDLPGDYSRLTVKLREFAGKDGKGFNDGQPDYDLLISKKFCNQNTRVIKQEAGEWLIARYAATMMQIPQLWVEYNIECVNKGWEPLRSHEAVRLWLEQPENKRLWEMRRRGKNYVSKKYAYQSKRNWVQWRDSLWLSDGTKLNLYYQRPTVTKAGNITMMKAAKLNVYEVIDAHSEILLGHYLGESAEDYTAQYNAYRAAIQFSQHKPYECRYDNQGGHKKLESSSFLKKLSHITHRTMPYNPASKTIENIFGRFQRQFLSKLWFFTGMNITASSPDSRINEDYINANLKNLPTREEVAIIYEEYRNKWNNAPHPKHPEKSRMQVYLESKNPDAKPVDYLEMVELFWMQHPKPARYENSGISFQINGEVYEYEVLRENEPDSEFRTKYMDTYFSVKYDPNNYSYIRLYEDTPTGLRYIAIAQPRITVPYGKQGATPEELARVNKNIAIKKAEVAKWEQEITIIETNTGISKQSLIDEEVQQRNRQPVYAHVQHVSTGQQMKEISNMDSEDQEYDAEADLRRQILGFDL
jgi:hypothetical protein